MGAPVPRRLPRVVRYRSSLGLVGKSECKRVTASAVGTCSGLLPVEWRFSSWYPAKKNVLFLRTGPPAVKPKMLSLKTACLIPYSLSRFETELKRCD